MTHIFDTYKGFAETSGFSAERLVKDLAEYGKVFKRLVLPHDSPRINLFLNRLSAIDTATVYPFLLESFRLYDPPGNWKELQAIVCALESFLVRRMVCHLTSKNYNRLFLELLAHAENNGGVSSKSLIEFLKRSSAETARWPDEQQPLRDNIAYFCK